jgi:hypothetical protein
MTATLLFGALVSFINFGIHAIMTGLIVVATRRTASVTSHLGVFGRLSALLTITVTVLMVAHVVEVGVWATYYRIADVIPAGAVNAFEFAFENYTALGYGEPVPGPGHRLTGPITALNGLLLIGWSVAIIFEVMRMAELQIGHKADAGRRKSK